MGLGKTVQGIAAAELMARHFGVRRVLVVCPTSLKHQWQMEIKRFAGRDAQVLGGLRQARLGQWREDVFCKIVNYETLVRDADLAEAWGPELMIVDEAQRVKNWDTQAARAIKRIAAPAVCPHVIVLTGTPLENRLEELVSIVQIVDQHRLGPTWRLLHAHQDTDEAGRVTGYRDLHLLGQTLAPILLRRRKADVLTQLPERVDKTLLVPLTPQQRAHHDENGAIVSRIVTRWRQTGYLSDADQRRLQCALQNMRMACNSTWLLDKQTDHGTKAGELMTVLEEIFEDPHAKAVVFSQWLGTHEVLMRRLAARGWGHVFFHGGVAADRRAELVRQFHDDPDCRLFLSTDAGSTGLNLQHAAAVIVNMDQPWNPAILEQRIGRVHRMGQRRGVQVINLVAEESIEQGMLSLLAFKKSLFAGVLDGGDSSILMEGGRLTRFMRSVDALADKLARDGVPMLSEAGEEAAPARLAAASPSVEQQGEPLRPSVETSIAAPSIVSEPISPSPVSHQPQPQPQQDPWAPLLQIGLQCLQALASAQAAGPSSLNGAVQPGMPNLANLVHTDASSGERYLRLPLPDPHQIQMLADALSGVLASTGLMPVTGAPVIGQENVHHEAQSLADAAR
ncbi:MAG: DEAD/DEAH box helicase [Aquabacterium sp.]|uniref:DEAD/DEAH box helicase n=1 Tax=Aquabacterium sp. TaxID=1872578 RepID=UPI003BAF1686